jgi:hypothetical protein
MYKFSFYQPSATSDNVFSFVCNFRDPIKNKPLRVEILLRKGYKTNDYFAKADFSIPSHIYYTKLVDYIDEPTLTVNFLKEALNYRSYEIDRDYKEIEKMFNNEVVHTNLLNGLKVTIIQNFGV